MRVPHQQTCLMCRSVVPDPLTLYLRRQRTCLMCRSVCCSSCMQRVRLCGVGRQCLRCTRLASVRYERAALQQMTVRDLKHILKIVDVSTATCRGKSGRPVVRWDGASLSGRLW